MPQPARHRIFLTLLLMPLLLLSACGPSAKGTLNQFLDATLKGQHAQVYALHASADQAVQSEQAFLAEKSGMGAGLAQIVNSQTRYQILSLEETGEQAQAEVEMDLPDYSKVMGAMMGDIFKSAFSAAASATQNKEAAKPEQSQQEIATKMQAHLKNAKDLPRITRRETYQLVKEDGQWRVFANWAQDQRIARLREEAKALQDKEDISGSKARYDEILSLRPSDADAQEQAKSLGAKLERQAAHRAYFAKLPLSKVKVEPYDGYFADHQLVGTLKNTGDRTLLRVTLAIYYLNAKGQPIFEESYAPITASDADDQDELLKPGYVKEFSHGISDVPSEWAGKVKVEISKLEFLDEQTPSDGAF
ncbi:MAG: hypothetical protein ACO1RX_18885 [Candidatus Sericytochromatia bacterium]